MTFPPIGWLCFGLALLFLGMDARYSYRAMLFLIPFTATAVLNVGSGDESSGLQATMLFGVVWLMRSSGALLAALSRPSRATALLLVFLGVAAVSLIMPLIINGSYEVASIRLGDNQMTPVVFSARHVTQFAYLAYGVLISVLVAKVNTVAATMRQSLRLYIWSGLFVSVWGLLQWALSKVGAPYPDFIFNTSTNIAAMGYANQVTSLGATRLSSVAVEPSILAQYLLTIVPLLIGAIAYKRALISRSADRVILIVILTVLALSASTTAYIGLVVTLVLYAVLAPRFRLLRAKVIALAVFLAFATAAFVYFMWDYILEFIILKPGSYSAVERAESVVNGWTYFQTYPVLGVGWGTIGTHDLFVGLLSATGIVGCAAFTIWIVYLFKRVYRLLGVLAQSGVPSANEHLITGLLVSLAVLLFTSATIGFPFMFGYFWFVVGLVLAAAASGELRTESLQVSSGIDSAALGRL